MAGLEFFINPDTIRITLDPLDYGSIFQPG